MKIKFKEDPKEWRKSALLTVLGLAIISSLLRWRRHLPMNVWCAVLGVLTIAAVIALLRPRWCRGWYRLSLRLGYYSSQFAGRCALMLFFALVVTPVGLALRLAGKDPLQLKRPRDAATFWHPAKDSSPLDRLF